MAGLSPAHLIVILIIALVVIGPGKLPEVGAAIGKSLREVQKATGQAPEAAAPAQPLQAAPVQPMLPAAPAQSFYAAQPGYPVQYAAPVYAPATAPAEPAAAQQPLPADVQPQVTEPDSH